MPLIDREQWAVLEPLLDEALDLSVEDQRRWLAALRVRSPEIADELTSLLLAEAAADQRGFLIEPPEMTLEGLQVGAYTLERPLGRGGMGSVWLASRTDGRFEGRAAVKLLSLALLGAAGQIRFRAEGSMLARLTHPGIARLLDAGVASSGQPYLVLEHVDGQPIDAFVEQHRLPVDECIRLFLQVLAAVGHAHANLIVHRDLKPSNILVAADGSVKLLDFGIATLLDAEVPSDRTAIPNEDRRALTPQFAAPEQVREGAVTTATDVYALGAILYLLLSGRHPTGEGCVTGADAIRAVLEVEPTRTGKGDLDEILAKALRKAPEDRYQTVTAFANDLERYLRHEPVSARPGSFAYRARKFTRRNRAAVAAAAAAVLLASAYVVTLRRDRERVRLALAEATLGTRKAEQVTDFAVGLFEGSGRGDVVADSVTARELLAHGTARARELSGQPAVEAQMLDVIGRIHAERGEYAQARSLLEEGLAIRRKVLGDEHVDVATSLINVAQVADLTEHITEAVSLFRHAFEIRRRLLGDDDPRTTDALYEVAQASHTAGDFRSARPLFDQWAAAIARQPRQVSPARASQLIFLASMRQFSGRLDEAERLAREALAINRLVYGERHHRVGSDLSKLGSILSDASKHEQADSMLRVAVVLLRASYPEGHVELADALRNLGSNLEMMDRWQEAEGVWREAAAVYQRAVGANKLSVANARLRVGYAMSLQGRHDEAVAVIREVLRSYDSLTPASGPVAVLARVRLGDALGRQGKFAEAESILVAGYNALNQPSRMARTNQRFASEALVRLYEAQGRSAEAAKYRRSAER
jgi:tetratricopeptide (TPR) repeat protein